MLVSQVGWVTYSAANVVALGLNRTGLVQFDFCVFGVTSGATTSAMLLKES